MPITIARIRGHTRTLGESQGFLGLPIRDGVVKDVDTGKLVHTMESAWSIELPDIKRLINGEPLIVQLWGKSHPPIMLKVGDDFALPPGHPDADIPNLIGFTKRKRRDQT